MATKKRTASSGLYKRVNTKTGVSFRKVSVSVTKKKSRKRRK